MKEIGNYTRVTEPLYFLSGLSFINKDVLENAKHRGTAVHALCTANILGLPVDIIEVMKYANANFDDEYNKVQTQYQSFIKWKEGKSGFQIPERFFCDTHMLTGECDVLYQDGKDLVLVDFKTPAQESKTWKLQGSAYSRLAKMSGYPINRIEFVKLCKKGNEPKVFTYEEDFNEYLKCLHIYVTYLKNAPEENPLDYL